MNSHSPKRTIVALGGLIVAGAVLLMLGSCGDDGSDALSATPVMTPSAVLPAAPSTLPGSTTPPTTPEPTTGESPAVPAVPSIAVDYSCGDGSTGSAELPTGDLELIDDTVNTIDLCEFRGGLAEISFVASCPSGARPVTVPATAGGLPDLATLDLCERTVAAPADPAVPDVPSIAVDYSCGDGSTGSAELPTGDLELIDDTVNTIDLCEFRGGLDEISFVASCPSGARPVTVPATAGGLPDLATLDLCERTVAAPADPAVPAVPSIAVDYSCGDGSTGSAELPTGHLELIDDTVNTIDLCEFRGGLDEISFVASCPSGARPVTVPATAGGLPDLATVDLCETAA